MSKVILNAVNREVVGKQMRTEKKEGQLPVVVYGHGVAAKNIWVSALEFKKLYSTAGESSIIELLIEGEKMVNVLIHDIQLNPLTGAFTHADLLQVRMNEAIEAHIPLEFVGEAPAVKTLGGMLLKNTDEVLVSCMPGDLPHSITIDISSLATFDDHITIADIVVSDKVKVLGDADMVIAGVAAPRTEAEIADLDVKVEADVTKVEGIIKTDTETK